MDTLTKCPICLNVNNNETVILRDNWEQDLHVIDCATCGKFTLSDNTWSDSLDPQCGAGYKLTARCRASISHKIRAGCSSNNGECLQVSDSFIVEMIDDGCIGVTPAVQATNAIRLIGDIVSETGEKATLETASLFAIIGAPSPDLALSLIGELVLSELISGRYSLSNGEKGYTEANLTLAGWERYEAEKKGEISGNYGFIAMKFGDPVLETLVKDVLKPAIGTHLPYKLQDVRDIAQAGIIDNIMRAQIRGSAFVIVDLTHDNSGAYWEAGYAEGLGKPVVYICEETKFEESKTHFDTNHCTTVMWSKGDNNEFTAKLIATLRGSLNLF